MKTPIPCDAGKKNNAGQDTPNQSADAENKRPFSFRTVTQEEFNDEMNRAEYYQIEDFHIGRSHMTPTDKTDSETPTGG